MEAWVQKKVLIVPPVFKKYLSKSIVLHYYRGDQSMLRLVFKNTGEN